MEEQVDLDSQRQQEINELEAKVGKVNLYELLGVRVGAPVEDVRTAFRELSRKFHPDRYFGKNLGSFRARLDKVFKALVDANQTLSDDTKRAAYLEANPFVRAAIRAASPQKPAPAIKSEAEAARDDERRSRLARHPYLLRVNKVQELLTRAREAVAKNEFSQAFSHLSQAAAAAPDNTEVKTLLAEVRKQNEVYRAESSFKHGLEALERQDQALALQAFKAAGSAGHAVGAFKAAKLMEAQAADVREITTFAQKAVDGAPGNVEYRVFLSATLERAGMKALAKKHLEEAIRLDPNHPDVKKQGKRRWPF